MMATLLFPGAAPIGVKVSKANRGEKVNCPITSTQ
jgi:hypothetical protein